ncbi:hypothetical protein A0H81_11208 [Grifola frondosa]|uniref:Uncharacterized protein n=1 Tax=Grifola frondosa TaxID=5627 RepID=A0A1C7LW36_GRIFR|nr:hypothetical protein A0H81_11208 [Grifola frondosa]
MRAIDRHARTQYSDHPPIASRTQVQIPAALVPSGLDPPATPALWGRMEEGCGDEPRHHGGYNRNMRLLRFPNSNSRCCSTTRAAVETTTARRSTTRSGRRTGGTSTMNGRRSSRSEEHEKNEEEKKALTWALQNWLHDAQARTADFRQNGPRGPDLDPDRGQAYSAERDSGWPGALLDTIYSRAFHDGGIQVGKASDAFKKGGSSATAIKRFTLARTRSSSGICARPVEGGAKRTAPHFTLRRRPPWRCAPGKASEKLDAAFIPYDGTEVAVKDYQVLCYA